MQCATLRTVTSFPEINKIDQVNFICENFKLATSSDINVAKTLDPCVLRKEHVRFSSGFADLVEINGHYTRDIAEAAIAKIKVLSHGNNDAIVTLCEENGFVNKLRFVWPVTRGKRIY